MFNTDFHILQANLCKFCEIGHNLFSNNKLQSFVAILTTELWANRDKLTLTLNSRTCSEPFARRPKR